MSIKNLLELAMERLRAALLGPPQPAPVPVRVRRDPRPPFQR